MSNFYLLIISIFCTHVLATEGNFNNNDLSCSKEVKKDCVVTFDYTLTDGEENFIDTSHGSKPRIYLQGRKDLLPSIMQALNGRHSGEKFEITLTPLEGYGEYDKDLIKTVPLSAFGTQKVERGMEFKTTKPDGSETAITVISVENGKVIVDGNHPLSGKTLKLSLEILSIRPPTSEELKNGIVEN